MSLSHLSLIFEFFQKKHKIIDVEDYLKLSY